MSVSARGPGPDHPERIGPYRILRLLGEGGMGLVYEAEQRVELKRRVALKVMKPGLDTKEVLARFEAERQALAVMQHPGIAKVLDAGATEEGRPYFVMELVDGESLKEYADGQKLSIEDRVSLFIKVCQAVQHAHLKGVIHRDLKPSNILVTERDDAPTPKVIDFGIAKATGQRLTETTLVTSFGQALGTPAYMSPEQADASGLDVDTRTDVYSLGVTLYELLVGRLPQDPDDLGFAGFMTQLLMRDSDPPTPSTRYDTLEGDFQKAIARFRRTDPRGLRHEIQGDLDWITMKAIENDRERRYATANGLAMDLERYLRDEPVLARPPSARYRASKFVRRHRTGVVAGIIVTVGLLLGGALATAGMTRARQAEKVAEVEAKAAREVADFLEGLFEVADPAGERGGDVTVREILDEGAEKIRTELAGQPLTQARLMNSIGNVYRSVGLYEDAETMLQTALSIREDAYGPNHPEVATSLADLGVLYLNKGDHASAQQFIERALTVRERTLGPRHRLVAESLDNLGGVYYQRGEFSRAESLHRRARSILRDVLGDDDPDVAAVSLNLGIVYLSEERFEEAEVILREALSSFERALGPQHYNVSVALLALGELANLQGKYVEAEALYRESMEIVEVVMGPDHPDVAINLNNIATTYFRRQDYASAEPFLRRALEIFEAKFGPYNANVATPASNLAMNLSLQGKDAESEALFVRALEIRQESLGPEALPVGEDLTRLAVFYRFKGRYADAEPLLLRALAIQEAALGPDDPTVASTLENYAFVLRALGRTDEPDSLETRAKAIRDKASSGD